MTGVVPLQGVTIPEQTESIRKRYFATLISNSLSLVASFVLAGIVPRALGPVEYGDLSFLRTSAAAFRGFTDLGASQAFFTYSSKERRSGSFSRLYGIWLFIQLVLVLGAVFLTASLGFAASIWPGQRMEYIVWVVILDWVAFLVVSLRQLGDSKGLTTYAQLMSAAFALLNLLGILVLYFLQVLTLLSFVWLSVALSIVLAFGLGVWLLILHKETCWSDELSPRLKEHLRYWYRYSSPLVVWGIWGVLVTFAERYLIQLLYGSSEQAYFALASNWSSLVLVFTSSLLMIYWREIASALGRGEKGRAGSIYLRFDRITFFLAITLAVFFSFQGSRIIDLVVGPKYRDAAPVLAIMAFYPVQQTIGSLNGTIFLASERTREYRNLGIALSAPTIILTYFLLATPTAFIPGLGLGSVGLAVKTAFVGLVTVQPYIWLNCRFFALSYMKLLLGHIAITAMVGVSGGIILETFGWLTLVILNLGELTALSVASVAYFSAMAILLFLRPDLAGLTKTELISVILQLRSSAVKYLALAIPIWSKPRL